MTAIMKSIRKYENKVDRKAERFVFLHPYLSLLTMFIGMPLLILMAVAVSTTLITLPMAWVFGWA